MCVFFLLHIFLVLLQIKFRKCKPLPRTYSRTWFYLLIVTLTSNLDLNRQVFQRAKKNMAFKLFIPLPACGGLSPLPTSKNLFLIQRGATVQRILSHSEHTDALSFLLNLNHLKILLLLLKILMSY